MEAEYGHLFLSNYSHPTPCLVVSAAAARFRMGPCRGPPEPVPLPASRFFPALCGESAVEPGNSQAPLAPLALPQKLFPTPPETPAPPLEPPAPSKVPAQPLALPPKSSPTPPQTPALPLELPAPSKMPAQPLALTPTSSPTPPETPALPLEPPAPPKLPAQPWDSPASASESLASSSEPLKPPSESLALSERTALPANMHSMLSQCSTEDSDDSAARYPQDSGGGMGRWPRSSKLQGPGSSQDSGSQHSEKEEIHEKLEMPFEEVDTEKLEMSPEENSDVAARMRCNSSVRLPSARDCFDEQLPPVLSEGIAGLDTEVAAGLDRFFGNDQLWTKLRQEATGLAPSAPGLCRCFGRLAAMAKGSGPFQVQVPRPYPGVQFRRSKCLDDRCPRYAQRDTIVHGVVEDGGNWLRVDSSSFLPVVVGNLVALAPVSLDVLEAAGKHTSRGLCSPFCFLAQCAKPRA